jgi:hypothetical protein
MEERKNGGMEEGHRKMEEWKMEEGKRGQGRQEA